MNVIFDKLDQFYKKDDLHVFLLKGAWGTGKTFAIDKWCERISIEQYNISLFGVSSASELYERFLDEIYVRNKIIDKVKDVDFNAEAYGIKLGVKGLLSIFKQTKFVDNKKRVIIFDDIERKDNNISIETIFGLIDYLKIEKTKIILISNSDEFNENDKGKFNGFKEKIVDMEYTITDVSTDVIKKVLSNDELYDLLNLSYTNNLRSLIKLKRIISSENIEIKKENEALIQSILFAIESVDNGKFSRNDLINERIRSLKIFNYSNNKEQLEAKIQKEREEVLLYNDGKVFSESVNDKFTKIKRENLINNLEKIYLIVKCGDYKKLQSIEFDYSNSLEKPFYIDYQSLSFNHNRTSFKYILDSVNDALVNDYDKMSIFVSYINFYCRYYSCLETYKLISFSNELKNKVVKEVIYELLNYNYEWSDYFNQLYFEETEIIEKGRNNEIKLELGKKFQNALIDNYIDNINIGNIKVIIDKLTLLFRSLNISKSFVKTNKYLNFHKKMVKCIFKTLNISDNYYDEKLMLDYVNYLKAENIVYDDIKQYVNTKALNNSKAKMMINREFNNV